jgi:dTDP-glucose 4,6-dehydratase
MKVLVTGGAGFIGSNYVHHALSKDPTLDLLNVDAMTYAASERNLKGVYEHDGYRFLQADVADAEAMAEAFREFKPERVVHFAAESHVDRSIEAGDVFVRTNVLGTQTLLDAARRHDVEAFVQIGTDEVYGSLDQGSFMEEDPLRPSSPYSASKAAADLMALAHHRTYGTPVVVTRCTNNYGPRQHQEKLIPKVIANALNDEPIPVYGTGRNVRDWLFVGDHCRAIDFVLHSKAWGKVFNISGQDERENLDVVRLILSRLGKPESLIQMVDDRPGHDWRYSVDDGRIRALGWTPETRFEDGIDATISWVKLLVGETAS